MCCFFERSLSKIKSRLRTVPENSASVLLRETVCGCGKVAIIEDDDEKRIASVLSFFQCEVSSFFLFSFFIHSPMSLIQP